MKFVRVAKVTELFPNRGKLIRVDDREIALWQVDGKIYAINNVCPHQHFSMLHQGTLDGAYVTCPMHGWSFSLEDGAARSGGGKARTYKVKVEGGDVYVERPVDAW